MKHLPDLDFALDRAARQRWRTGVFAVLGLCFGLQLGIAAWRLQTMESSRAALDSQYRQLVGKTTGNDGSKLSPENAKVAADVRSMFERLSVPWEDLMSAIETARTQRIVVDAIQPRPEDGTVSISVSSHDYAAVADFIRGLTHQEQLQEVILVSETLAETGGSGLRAVISARWRKLP